MLKKTIHYTDFNDQEQEEVFYFHLSKAEIIEMEASVSGGLSESLKKIIKSNDNKEIVEVFKNIILSSVGEKSDDGKRFVKNDEIREDFKSSPAFDELFMTLATDETQAEEFVKGILPLGVSVELPSNTVNGVEDSLKVLERLEASKKTD